MRRAVCCARGGLCRRRDRASGACARCCGSAPTTGSPASTRRSRRRSTPRSRGDWILVAPGRLQDDGSVAPTDSPSTPAGVLMTTPHVTLRGMNRNTVIVDGTKPGSPQCSSRRPTRTSGPPMATAAARPQRDHGVQGRRRVGPEPDRVQLPRPARAPPATRSGGTAATAAARSAAGASTART